MTAKDKAKELVDKFKSFVIFTLSDFTISDHIRFECQKSCALIAIDEVIEYYPFVDKTFYYLKEVKEEIKKL